MHRIPERRANEPFYEKNCAEEAQGCQVDLRRLNFSTAQNKTPTALAIGVSEFNLDDDLLSHGETPHYHRRCIVSLLSSGWDQVVPMFYGRQEIRVPNRAIRRASANRVCDSQSFRCRS